MNHSDGTINITLIIIAYIVTCVILLVLSRIFRRCKSTIWGFLCVGIFDSIFILLTFPILIVLYFFWLICHCIIDRVNRQRLGHHNLAWHYEREGICPVICMLFAFVVPNVSFIGFIISVINPSIFGYKYMWNIFGSINVFYFTCWGVIFLFWIFCDSTTTVLQFAICIFFWPLWVVVLNIFLCFISLLCLMKIYEVLANPLMNYVCEAIQIGNDEILKKKERFEKSRYKKEYTKYTKYYNVFIKERKTLLMGYTNDNKDIVNIIINYLDSLEIKYEFGTLFQNKYGDYLNDCGVVAIVYKIDIEAANKHITKKTPIISDYTLMDVDTP
eukprot:262162_1